MRIVPHWIQPRRVRRPTEIEPQDKRIGVHNKATKEQGIVKLGVGERVPSNVASVQLPN